jgi:hypothetical protein
MPKKKLTDKMLKEIVYNMPKPLLDYLTENSTKPIENLQLYAKGFQAGMDFIAETIVKPYIDKVEKILHS